jgi:hypothetical protein
VLDGLDLADENEPFGGYSYSAGVYDPAPRPRAFCAFRILARNAPTPYELSNHFRRLAREFLGLPASARDVP